MAEYAQLKAAINAVIKQNGRMEITGEVLNQVLTAMVNSLGRSMGCAGVATPATNPQSPDQNLFYFAVQAGTYVNFNSIELPAGISVLMWNGTWTAQTWFIIKDAPEYQSTDFISAGGVFDSQKVDGNAYDISEHFPTGGVNNTNEYTLSGALAKIPENMKKAGMSIKFKESTTHNYMVLTHVGSDTTNFTSINLWQGVANSNELFHSPTAFMRKQIPTIGAVLDEFGTQSVQSLPTPSNATMNRIYVVQSKHPETDNVKTEWITIKVGNNYQWECIGGDTTSVYDLSDAMAVGGEPATYGSLSDALAAVPADKKRAGMTLAFIGLHSDMYGLGCHESSSMPQDAIELDDFYDYGDGEYTLAQLNDMFYSMSGAPIPYPDVVGRTITLYYHNEFTDTYEKKYITLLPNQRIYEQYRFAGTDINDFTDESLWVKCKKIPTSNKQIANDWRYITQIGLEGALKPYKNAVRKTWAELHDMKEEGALVAGTFYRITDYMTTCTSDNTMVEQHQFDIIVLALSDDSLSEQAWATLHDGDTYFTSNYCNLNGWRLWYTIENDTDRFAWADEDGKGVIYRMIDEWGNDCPFDFKNIKFKAKKVVGDDRTSRSINRFVFDAFNDLVLSSVSADDQYFYVFSYMAPGSSIIDASVDQYNRSDKTHNNFIDGRSLDGNDLPRIIFIHDSSIDGEFECFYNNKIGVNCNGLVLCGHHNTIGAETHSVLMNGTCYNNILKGCYDIELFGSDNIIKENANGCVFGNCQKVYIDEYCESIDVADDADNIILGKEVMAVSIGSDSSLINIGAQTTSVTIGEECTNINIGNVCNNVTIGEAVIGVSLGYGCVNIEVADGCDGIIIGGNCSDIEVFDGSNHCEIKNGCIDVQIQEACHGVIVGYESQNILIGVGSTGISVDNNCDHILIGDSSKNITLGFGCQYVYFGETDESEAYVDNVHIANGTNHLKLQCAVATSNVARMRNINIAMGFSNANGYTTIVHPSVNDNYCTTYEPTGSQTTQVTI